MARRIPHVRRFSLRALFVLTSILAVWVALRANQARRQHCVVKAVQQWGGHLTYDYESAEPPGPLWLRQRIGDDFFIAVTGITFSGDRISDAQFESILDDLAHLPKLRRLNLWHADVSERVLELVGHRLQRLHILCVPSKKITDEGLIHIQMLPELRHLGLWDTSITGAGLIHVADLPKLEKLLLQNSKITDQGLKNVSRLTGLRKLDLSGNPELTNSGMKSVAKLKELRWLRLKNCTGVTDECLVHIAGLSNLNWFDSEGSSITNDGLKLLKKKLPRITTRPLFKD